MQPRDYVYDQIFKGAMAAGASERNAKDRACMGLDDFKKNRFKKVADLIGDRIKKAANMPV